jgi:hypothetical protein
MFRPGWRIVNLMDDRKVTRLRQFLDKQVSNATWLRRGPTCRLNRRVIEVCQEAIVSRVDLRVPITEKEEAKRLGARWDAHRKLWYVPDGVRAEALQKWVPVSQTPNVRAASYFVATTTRACWCCQTITRVVGVVLPAGHEILEEGDDPVGDFWDRAPEPALLSYVSDLIESVAVRLQQRAPLYRVDFSQTTQSFYWMNHCANCEAKLGDFETFNELGVAFEPRNAEQASAIELEKIAEPFSGACSTYTCGLEWFNDARQR